MSKLTKRKFNLVLFMLICPKARWRSKQGTRLRRCGKIKANKAELERKLREDLSAFHSDWAVLLTDAKRERPELLQRAWRALQPWAQGKKGEAKLAVWVEAMLTLLDSRGPTCRSRPTAIARCCQAPTTSCGRPPVRPARAWPSSALRRGRRIRRR